MDYPLADLPEDEEYNQYNDQPSPSSSTRDDYYGSDADNYNNPRRRKQLVLAGLSLILVVMLVLPLAVVLWAPLLRPAGISLLQRLAGILRFIVMTSAISAGIISTSSNGSHKFDGDRKEGAKRDSVSGKWGRNSIRSGRAFDMPAKGDQVSRINAEKGKGILASHDDDDDANHDDKARAWRDVKMKAAEAEIDSSSGGVHQGAGYGGGEIEAIEIKEPNSPQSSSSSLRRFQKIDTMEIKEAYVRPEVSAPSMDELWRRNMRAGTSADRINALKREDAGAPRRTIHKQRSLEGAFVSPLKPQNNNILYSNAAGSLHHRSSAFPNQAATATMTAINQPVRAHSGSKANVASGGGNAVQDQKLGPKPVTNHDKAASSHHNSVKDQRLGPNPVTNYDKAASSHYNVVKDQRLGPNPVTKVASSHHNTNANMSINKHHQHVLLASKKHSRSDDNLHKVASSSSPSSPSSSSRPQSSAPSSSTIRSRRQRGTSVSYDFGADYGPEWLYDLDPLPSPESIFVAGFNRSHQHNHASSSLSAASSSASSMQNSRLTASQPLIEATEAQSLVPWRVAGSQPIDIVRPRNASQHDAASAPLEDASNDGADDQVSPISAPSLKKRADDFIAKFNEQLMKQKRESLERRREWSMMHGGQPPP